MKGSSWIFWGLCLFVVALIVIGGGSMAWEYFVSGSATIRVRQAEAEAARAAAEADKIAAEADRLRAAGEMTEAEGVSYKTKKEGDAQFALAEAAARSVRSQTTMLSFYGFITPGLIFGIFLLSSIPNWIIGAIIGGMVIKWRYDQIEKGKGGDALAKEV